MTTSTALLSVCDVTRRFGSLRAVDGLSFDIAEGEIVGLLGPNGSGKTTMMNLVSGALKPDAGTIRLAGSDIAGLPPNRIARQGIARTFQLVRVLPSMNCLDNVKAGLGFGAQPTWGATADSKAEGLLERVGMAHRRLTLGKDLTYMDQKRLELARALALQPRLLLLDEWLAGLNPSELVEAIELLRKVRGEGVTMVMVEHVMDAIRSLCDRCVIMNAGAKIAEGMPAEALAEPEVVRAYLGDDADA
ncbi:ABC transporter ATP-binding protein [Billgrantia montanilacus]|uniref:ABC transporter ATP-binding protein n=1 Tax=Billgrantia montanilacus TaxID=2282305 RepID=A0A368TV07_9GAMM|nr:ABC transporter ATP-binding protein [Halomonas montanilacus]RCV88186.1 ABC transporter ATP-binding protein [Halomonas montanilacus]